MVSSSWMIVTPFQDHYLCKKCGTPLARRSAHVPSVSLRFCLLTYRVTLFNFQIPNDLPVRVLGSRVNIIVGGSKQEQQEAALSEEQAKRLHAAIVLAIKEMHEELFLHSQNLFVDSMAQLFYTH